jgi:hypothetical protein
MEPDQAPSLAQILFKMIWTRRRALIYLKAPPTTSQ